MSSTKPFGIIGGSGVYELLSDSEVFDVETPFGGVTVSKEKIHDVMVYFLPRHGKGHKIPPHQINYRANIFAFHELGVHGVLATNAVGSMRKNIRPGDFLVPDQVMDFTKQRASTFFTGEFEVEVKGHMKRGVVHTDVSEPFDETLRDALFKASKASSVPVHFGGTIVVTEGPRFETPAEVNAFRLLGGDVLGMTTAPEVFLAKELEIPYATLAITTNYAAGMQKQVSHQDVIEMFEQRVSIVREVLLKALRLLY